MQNRILFMFIEGRGKSPDDGWQIKCNRFNKIDSETDIAKIRKRLLECCEQWKKESVVQRQASVGKVNFKVREGWIPDPDGKDDANIMAADQEEEINWQLLTDGGGDTDELMEMRFW